MSSSGNTPATSHQPPVTLRIGTRKSPLALAQARLVAEALAAAHPELAEEGRIAIVPMMTSGDAMQAGPLAEIGGKGLFTKELEEALLRGDVDIAVHSAKDMQTWLPESLALACTLKREDVRDALLAPGYGSLQALPEGAVFGTSSLRRAAQVLRVRPDLQIIDFRGNVQTRLRKLAEGKAHASMLAVAGLKRLKLEPMPGVPLPLEQFIPAVAQGAIAIECRAADAQALELLAPLNHGPTLTAIACERELLAKLDGSCRTPVAGHAEIHNDRLHLRAMLASADGRQCWFAEVSGAVADALALGAKVGDELLAQRKEAGCR